MNAMTRLLASVNVPLLFLIVYILLYCLTVIRANKQLAVLGAELKKNSMDPEKCVSLTEKYIQSNPFSQANSTLRILMIPLLLAPQNKVKLNKTVRKIRAVDIDSNIPDKVLCALFLLKEYGLSSEYDQLKDKVTRSYKPFRQSIYTRLMQENIDFDAIENENLSVYTEQVRSTIAYYKGIAYAEQGMSEQANAQFEIAEKTIPNLSVLLNRRGITR